MAIDLGSKTITIDQRRRTWRVQIDTPIDGETTIEVFRELAQIPSEGTTTTIPDLVPLTLDPAKFAELAQFAEIPPQLAAVIPDSTKLAQLLLLLPALVAISCDAAERKKLAVENAD